MINLIANSLWNRKGTALLTLFSIAISGALLIGVEQIRKGVRTSFSSAVSGTDMIVGARGGSTELSPIRPKVTVYKREGLVISV